MHKWILAWLLSSAALTLGCTPESDFPLKGGSLNLLSITPSTMSPAGDAGAPIRSVYLRWWLEPPAQTVCPTAYGIYIDLPGHRESIDFHGGRHTSVGYGLTGEVTFDSCDEIVGHAEIPWSADWLGAGTVAVLPFAQRRQGALEVARVRLEDFLTWLPIEPLTPSSVDADGAVQLHRGGAVCFSAPGLSQASFFSAFDDTADGGLSKPTDPPDQRVVLQPNKAEGTFCFLASPLVPLGDHKLVLKAYERDYKRVPSEFQGGCMLMENITVEVSPSRLTLRVVP